MNLQYFPMDRQLCHIEIESCKYLFSNFEFILNFRNIKLYNIKFFCFIMIIYCMAPE